MFATTLINDLMITSPVIENNLSDVISSCLQEESDLVSMKNKLITEGLISLVELLKENGIVFHCSISDIISDRYNINHIILLYKIFNTENVIQFINGNKMYYNKLVQQLYDIPNNREMIVFMMEILKNTDNSQPYIDMYTYLHDKIINTKEYANFIIGNIDNIVEDNEYYILDENDLIFLNDIVKKRDWVKSVFDKLIHKDMIIERTDSLVNKLNKIGQLYIIDVKNVKLLTNYSEYMETNPDVIEALLNNLKQTSIFHMEHYTKQSLKELKLVDILLILFSQIIDHHLFGTDIKYNELIINYDESTQLIIKNIVDKYGDISYE